MLTVAQLFLLLNVISINHLVEGQLLEGLYCGNENCYDVLNVTRANTKSEISKNYRQLARKYHPDVHKGEDAKKEAEEQFKRIATAYEILKDEEARNDYDYMLDNPDQYYAHYYRYYRRRMAPKVDVRIVIFVTISVISIIQYYSSWQRYETAIKYFMTLPKYRNRAMDIAEEKGMIGNKKERGRSKYEQKKHLDEVIRKVIEENMDIKGAYAKPSIYDLLWIQLIISPYTVIKYIMWYVTWIWRFNIMKVPYGTEEKLYIIRKFLKMGQYQFDALEDEKKEEYLKKELWLKEKFQEWHKQEEENMKKSLADNNKYKAYRRYIKNHGVGRMTFDDS